MGGSRVESVKGKISGIWLRSQECCFIFHTVLFTVHNNPRSMLYNEYFIDKETLTVIVRNSKVCHVNPCV